MLVIDAEWPTQSDGIHMVGVNDIETGEYHQFEDADSFSSYMAAMGDVQIVGHWFIRADAPRLRDHWGVDLSDYRIADTYTMACLLWPGNHTSHSLDAWGERLGLAKGDFTDYDRPAEGETHDEWWQRMGEYMRRDVELTARLYAYLVGKISKYGVSEKALFTELEVAKIVRKQVENGFYFDIDNATNLYVMLTSRWRTLIDELQKEFPPIVEERWSEKTGKRLKDKVTVFNPGSSKQVAERLMERGVKLWKKTDKGNYSVTHDVLEHLDHPAAAPIQEYAMLQKRIGQMDEWFREYNTDTHRIHGDVNPLGTNTHRMSQSKPNLAQIPAVDKPYGKECRALFCVPEGKKLVGCDASGLELRLLANRLRSPEYKQVVEEGDVHTYNMEAAGLNDRSKAKTFIYAFIYGAGDAKLSFILGTSVARTRAIRKRFIENIPGFKEWKTQLEERAYEEGAITLLDGSKLFLKDIEGKNELSAHKFLNYQLQGDGAVVMKRALCYAAPIFDELGAKLVVQAHDEWQLETEFYNCDIVGQAAVKAIESVTQQFDMYVKLEAEYKVGTNWAETH